MESLFYMIIEFASGNLPWSYNMQGPDIRGRIKAMKEEITQDKLCQGFPSEFDAIWTYIRTLGFEDRPDYTSIKDMIEMAQQRIRNVSQEYDWKILALEPKQFDDLWFKNRIVLRDFYHEKGELSPSETREAEGKGKAITGEAKPPILKKMFLDTIDSHMRVKATDPDTRQASR